MRSVIFEEFDEARLDAGFFMSDVEERLGISRRTYYHWRKVGRVPLWAYDLIRLHGGDLTPIGLKRWRLNRDVLYHTDLNPKYHSWPLHELLSEIVYPLRRGEFQGSTNAHHSHETQQNALHESEQVVIPIPLLK